MRSTAEKPRGQADKDGLYDIHRKIVAVLKHHPEGLSLPQIRSEVGGDAVSQEQFGRRLRALRRVYDVRHLCKDGAHVYVLGRRRPLSQRGDARVGPRLRAEILHTASGKCQMCGRTIADDGVKLQADHKIPVDWGGRSERENLWAVCETCNAGKKAFFATFDAGTMKAVLAHQSVHRRILELLRLAKGKPVDSDMIEFVANFGSTQADWQKRLRELRYAKIDIEVSKKKVGRRVLAHYRLAADNPHAPGDIAAYAREYERRRAVRRRTSS